VKDGAEQARRSRGGPEPWRGILPSEIERILVLGASRSGVGAAEALVRRGRSVVLSDSKPRDALADLSGLEASGVEVVTGVQDGNLLEGIQLVVKSPGVPGEAPLVQRAREAHIPVWSEVELAFRMFPNVFVAVTGTNGKTTTTAMLGHLLVKDGRSVRLVGNIGQAVTSLGPDLDPAEELVVEVSSFQLEDVHAFRPAVAIFLNLTPDHLDRHHTMEAYVAAKMRLFARQGPGDVAVVNVGDPFGAALVEELRRHPPGPRVLTFSLEPQVEVDSWVEDDRLMLLGRPGPAVDQLILRGSHNLENALAAGTAALARRADFGLVCEGLKSFPGVPHRLEQAGTVGGISYVNDSKATNVEATLKALGAYPEGTHLILGGRDKGSDYRPIARNCGGCVGVYLVGEATPLIREAFAEVAAEAGEGLSVPPVEDCGDLESAMGRATERALPGQVVLLAPACASFDQYGSFEERGEHFIQLVRDLEKRA